MPVLRRVPGVAVAAVAGVVVVAAVAGVIVTHNDNGRPVGVSRDMPVPEDGRPVGVSRDMPVPRNVADVGVGVEESFLSRVADVGSILRHFADVGVGVEDIKVAEVKVAEVKVAEVKVAEVELANVAVAVAANFLFPTPSVKEDFIFCQTAVSAFTADRSSLSASDENIPGLIARWTAWILSDNKSSSVVARGREEPKAGREEPEDDIVMAARREEPEDNMVMAPEEDMVMVS